jgi:hypothetical protein
MPYEDAQYPALSPSLGDIHHQFNASQAHLEGLGAISPVQATYPPYTTPYPDSTASSAPSEEPILAEVDEDKRKRNQAASARFRQKKKQREQQMLEQTRAMQERTKKLETDVENLKRENTFLKKLLVEKVDNLSDEDKASLAKTAEINRGKI